MADRPLSKYGSRSITGPMVFDPVHVARVLDWWLYVMERRSRSGYQVGELVTGDTVLTGVHVAGWVTGVNMFGRPVVRVLAGDGEMAGLCNVERMDDHPSGRRVRPVAALVGIGAGPLVAGARGAIKAAAEAEQAKLTKEVLVDAYMRDGYSRADAEAQVDGWLHRIPMA